MTDTTSTFAHTERYTVQLHGVAWEHAQTMAVLAAWKACRDLGLPLTPQQCDGIALAVFRNIRGQVERRAKNQQEKGPVVRALTTSERSVLAFALDGVQEKIWSEGGFTEEDQAAVTSLRELTRGVPEADEYERTAGHAEACGVVNGGVSAPDCPGCSG